MSETRRTTPLTLSSAEPGAHIMQALLAGNTILTPDTRSAELIRERYTKRMQLGEIGGWASPSVLPWRVWAANFYTLAIPDGPALLSNEQALLIWELIVGGEDDISIEQVSQFTRLAAQAWATQHLWQIDVTQLNKSNSSFEVSLFVKWQREFEARCRDLKVIDFYQCLGRLKLTFEENIQGKLVGEYLDADRILVGYAKVPPLLGALSPNCWEIDAHGDAGHSNEAAIAHDERLFSYDDEVDEIAAAIEWAVALHLESPQKTIAIALSNPSMLGDTAQQSIKRYCSAMTASDNARLLSDLELQTAREIVTTEQPSLNQEKLLQSALRTLRFSGPLPCDELSAMLLDPYLGDWRAQRTSRALLDQDLRAEIRELRLTEGFVLNQMRREEYGLKDLADKLQAVSELRNNAPHRQSIIAWHEHFESQLALLSWPNQAFTLAAEQAVYDAWRQVLDTFVSLSAYAGLCTRSHALHRLDTIIQQRSFTTIKSHNAIRVLGFDEVEQHGPHAVAWCGLGQYQWPPVTQINPLLPHRLQREAGVPGSDVSVDTELAKRNLISSIEAVSHNRFSFSARLGDIDNLPVALFSEVDVLNAAADKEIERGFEFPVESKDDSHGLALDTSGRLRSAVRFFADQAACPFKAYAAHRLASNAIEEPALGLDARRRGELVHLAVASLWEALGSHQKLMSMDLAAIQMLIDSVVKNTVDEYRKTTRQLPNYWMLEATRLSKLLAEWLEVERARQGFDVVGVEQAFDASIAQFQFKIRVDRLDKLEDGALAVIDFKTGTDSKSSWAPPRIDQPQLPIYAVNFENEQVAAVAYAQIRSGKCDLKDLPQKALAKGLRDDAWQEQMREWRYDLNATAEEMHRGEARVDPKRDATCRYCEHRLLCRIGDQRTGTLDEDASSNGLVLDDGFAHE